MTAKSLRTFYSRPMRGPESTDPPIVTETSFVTEHLANVLPAAMMPSSVTVVSTVAVVYGHHKRARSIGTRYPVPHREADVALQPVDHHEALVACRDGRCTRGCIAECRCRFLCLRRELACRGVCREQAVRGPSQFA